MVEFRGILGDLVLRTEREYREGLSEGGWFYKSYAWHASWVDFFMLSFLLFFFFFFGLNNRAFGIGLGKFGPVVRS